MVARSKESNTEGIRDVRFRVRKFWVCFPVGGTAAKTMVIFEMQLNLYVFLVLFMEMGWLKVSL